MAMFTPFHRRSARGERTQGRELPEAVWHALPRRFEAVGEALASGSDPAPACHVVGRDAARDGAALGEALSGLRATFKLVVGTQPSFAAAEALATAWSEATLEYLNQLSCEDPLTGLASLAHVRTRVEEIYRDADRSGEPARGTHALVVVEMRAAVAADVAGLARALVLVRVTEAVRTVFTGGETVGRLGEHRAVAVVRRRDDLGRSVALLRALLGSLDLERVTVRVWIEGLPSLADSAGRLLDDLARSA